jgi:hypothetical protein
LTTEISDYQRARTPLSLDEVFVPAPVRYRTSFASATGWDRYDELIAHDGTTTFSLDTALGKMLVLLIAIIFCRYQ